VTVEPAAGLAYGRVLIVPLDDLPVWLPAWCREQLGGEPAAVLFQLHQVSMVFGLRLASGSAAVIKARAGDGRAVSGVAAQARLAERGFPCARPLTPVTRVGSLAVHAEAGPGAWPAIGALGDRDQSLVPGYVVDAAGRTRRRILAAGLPCVLGYADFEAQNLR
jgi:hypothetical protein